MVRSYGAELLMPTVILLPTAIGDQGDTWTQAGGSSKYNAVDPGDPISHDDGTSSLFTLVKAIRQSMKFEDLSTKVPSAKTVISVTFNLRLQSFDCVPTNQVFYRSCDATQVNVTVDGVAVLGASTPWADYGSVLPPADNGDWTVAKVDDAQLQWFVNDPLGGGRIDATSVWLVVQYGETVTTIEPPDEAARRRLRRYRFEEDKYALYCGPRAEQIRPWQDFRFQDPFAPEASGAGFGPEDWASRLLRANRKTIDPGTNHVTLEAIDPRRYLTTFYLQAISDAPGKTTGTIAINNGNVETFTRATKGWLEWKDGVVYEVPAAEKKHNHRGLLIEHERTNRILNSAFHVDGGGGADVFASWTELLSGAGISAGTALPYIDPAVSKQYLIIGNTNPAEDRGVNQETPFSFTGSSYVALSVVHRDQVVNDQVGLVICNTVTGNCLQADLTSWAASPVKFEPWPTRYGVWTRDTIVFPMESSGATLIVGLRNTIADGQVHIAQIDIIDDARFATSPIVTTTAMVTENQDELYYSNDFDQEMIPFTGEQFTIQLVIKPLFGQDTVMWQPSSYIYVIGDPTGVSTTVALAFKQDTGAGDNHIAFALGTPGDGAVKPTWIAGDELKIVHRRASSRGEQDLDAGKEQLMVLDPSTGLWIEGAQRTYTTLSPQSGKVIHLGVPNVLSAISAGPLDGYLVYMDVRPEVLHKEEAKDFP